MVRERPAQPPPYPAERARGGEIILRRRWQRIVFVVGLALPFVLLLCCCSCADRSTWLIGAGERCMLRNPGCRHRSLRSWKRRAKVIDQHAAAFILQGALDRLQRGALAN